MSLADGAPNAASMASQASYVTTATPIASTLVTIDKDIISDAPCQHLPAVERIFPRG